MDWWQIGLIILVSIIIGLLVGYLLSYFVIILHRKKPFFKKHETSKVIGEPLKFAMPNPLAGSIKKRVATDQQVKEQTRIEAEEARRVRETAKQTREEGAVIKEPRESIVSNLVAEIENNYRIASEPWTDKLTPFQTVVWDTIKSKIHILPANVQKVLAETYTDIRLANSIVWLSTDLGRRSHNLDDNYTKLCTTIAERLGKIKPLLEQLGE